MFTHKTLGNLLASAGFEIFKYWYGPTGELRVLARPCEPTPAVPYKEHWLAVPFQIYYRGYRYMLTRSLPRQLAIGGKHVVGALFGPRVAEAFIDQMRALKRRARIDFY
jgi:hypothetical protein